MAIAVRPAVGKAEQRKVLSKPPDNFSAWEIYQLGLWHLLKFTKTDNERARLLFKRAAEGDPGFASPHVGSSITHLNDTLTFGLRPMVEAARLAAEDARQAVGLDPKRFGGAKRARRGARCRRRPSSGGDLCRQGFGDQPELCLWTLGEGRPPGVSGPLGGRSRGRSSLAASQSARSWQSAGRERTDCVILLRARLHGGHPNGAAISCGLSRLCRTASPHSCCDGSARALRGSSAGLGGGYQSGAGRFQSVRA